MDPVRKVMGAVDGFQRRYRWLGVPYAVQKKFGDDNANLVVVSLAWYGFTAIIPLLLVVVTVFGYIGADSLGTGITNALHNFPVIGQSFPQNNPQDSNLHGNPFGLVVGLVGLLYGAQGVTQTAQLAMATVWNIPQDQRTGFLPRLGRSIAALITIGGAFLINSVVATYVSAGTSNYLIRVPVVAGLLVLNFGFYFAAFTLLTAKVIGPRGFIPGAIAGAVAFTALLTVGTGLLAHQVNNASETYGTFGAVIGIVVVLLLLAKLSMYAAELNPVLARGLYPRALPLGLDPTEADHQVLASLVHQEKRREDQAIGVGFGDDAVDEAAADARRAHPRRPADDDIADDAVPDETGGDARGRHARRAANGAAPGDARAADDSAAGTVTADDTVSADAALPADAASADTASPETAPADTVSADAVPADVQHRQPR
jgi:uncharacterized BrkB/YihY/UPF0761 family membrane protein